jgi:hypothetical protein
LSWRTTARLEKRSAAAMAPWKVPLPPPSRLCGWPVEPKLRKKHPQGLRIFLGESANHQMLAVTCPQRSKKVYLLNWSECINNYPCLSRMPFNMGNHFTLAACKAFQKEARFFKEFLKGLCKCSQCSWGPR